MKRQDAEAAQRLAVALDHFFLFCFPSEARRLAVLEESLALPSLVDSVSAVLARAQALQRYGLRLISTDPQRGIEILEEGVGLFEQIGDSAGLALCISIVETHGCSSAISSALGATASKVWRAARLPATGRRQRGRWKVPAQPRCSPGTGMRPSMSSAEQPTILPNGRLP